MITSLPALYEAIGTPDVILMCGLPGSGKSYIAERLAEYLGAHVLRSDDYRLKIFGDQRFSQGITEEEHRNKSQAAYDLLYTDAHRLIEQGQKVILDATHLNHDRSAAIERLKQVANNLAIAVVQSPDAIVYERCEADSQCRSQIADLKRVRTQLISRISERHIQWPSTDVDTVPVFYFWNS